MINNYTSSTIERNNTVMNNVSLQENNLRNPVVESPQPVL